MIDSNGDGVRPAPNLQEKVSDWLRNEGYPLEFRTAKAFRQAGFGVRQGVYARSDGETPREIDVMAEINHRRGGTLLRVTHIVECKWTRDHPWVVLSSRHARIAPSACAAQTMANDLGEAIIWCLAGDPAFNSLEIFSAPERPGFGGRQALTKGKDLFYSAVQSVIGATKTEVDYHNQSASQDTLEYAEIGLPLIVIDGSLFEAYLDDGDSDMKVEPRASMRLHFRGADAWNYHATLDIVTIDALPEFLTARKKSAETLLLRAENVMNQLRECVRQKSLDPLMITRGSRGTRGLPPLIHRMDALFRADFPELHQAKKPKKPKGTARAK